METGAADNADAAVARRLGKTSQQPAAAERGELSAG